MGGASRRSDRSSETTFVDVAMALLGPIALFMLVFMVITGLYLKEREDCATITPEHEDALVLELVSWVDRAKGVIKVMEESGDICEENPDVAKQVRNTYFADLPPDVSGICRPNIDAVFAKSKIDPDHFHAIRDTLPFAAQEAADCVSKHMNDCTFLSEEEKSKRAQALTQWERIIDQKLTRTKMLADKRKCSPLNMTPANTTAVNLLYGAPPFEGLCRDNVLKVANVAKADLDKLKQKLTLLDMQKTRLSECISEYIESQCITLDKGETTKAAATLNAWKSDLQKEQRVLIDTLAKSCTNTPLSKTPPTANMLPPSLNGICQRDISRVFEQTSLNRIDIDVLGNHVHQLRATLMSCLKNPQTIEPIELTWPQFKSCSVEMEAPKKGQRLTEKVKRKAFQDIAKRIEQKLASGRFNRIDIFGHTDQLTVKEEGCDDLKAATNNERLSSLRAHAFLEYLRKITMANSSKYPQLKLFLDETQSAATKPYRIYAIGVGKGELKYNCPTKNENCNKKNRRIEIRVAVDNRGKGLPR